MYKICKAEPNIIHFDTYQNELYSCTYKYNKIDGVSLCKVGGIFNSPWFNNLSKQDKSDYFTLSQKMQLQSYTSTSAINDLITTSKEKKGEL